MDSTTNRSETKDTGKLDVRDTDTISPPSPTTSKFATNTRKRVTRGISTQAKNIIIHPENVWNERFCNFNELNEVDGFYAGISMEKYRAIPALHYSSLKDFAISPAHYKYPKPRAEGTANVGSLIHLAILEPDLFNDKVVCVPDMRTKEGKNRRDEALASGKVVANQSQYDVALSVSSAFRNKRENAFAHKYVQGACEVSGYVRHPEYGFLMAIRPDVLSLENGLISDLKTIPRGMRGGFLASHAMKQGWNLQIAYYLLATKFITNQELSFQHIYIELDPPYQIQVRYLSWRDDLFKTSLSKVEELLEKYSKCLASDTWPGYEDENDALPMGVPKWWSEEQQQNLNEGDGETWENSEQM
jgi:hypothetical protein